MIGRTNVVGGNLVVEDMILLEYLEGVRNACIDTGVKPTYNTMVEVQYMAKENDGFPYGSRTSSTSSDKHAFNHSTSSVIYPQFNNFVDSVTYNLPLNTVHVMKNGKDGFFINDNLVKSYTYSNFTSNLNLYLFALNQNDTINRPLSGRIYYCKIYENDKLIRHFIPVLDKNNVASMYDKINKKFYYNIGDGSFTAGPIMEV